MSDSPRIYPFKRTASELAVTPAFSLAQRARAASSVRYARLLLLAAAAFLLARAQILGGLYPFAPAFLAAAAVVYPRRGVVFALPMLLGLLTALQGKYLLVYVAIIALLAAVFLLYVVDAKKQWFVVPGMVAATVLVAKGLLLALTEYTNYQLMISIFEALIAAGLSLVFLVIFTALRRFDVARRFSADETVCIFLAATGMICGVSGVSVGMFELQSTLSRLIILVVAFLGGPGAGAAIGAMIGIVPSLSQVIAPSLVAAYSFSGLLAGVFSGFGRIGAALGFLLGNLILAMYLLTAAEISAYLLSSLAAGVLFMALPKRLYTWLSRAFSAAGLKSAKEEKHQRLLRIAVRKLRNSGWMFRELANSMNELADSEQPPPESGIRDSMELLSQRLCNSCSLRDICWEMDYQQTFAGIVHLFEVVQLHGAADIKDAPDNFVKRCPHIRELLAIVNCLYDLHCRSSYWQAQRSGSRQLIANQLSGVSEVLEKIAREITDFGDEREILERELQRAVAKRGLPIESAGITAISEKAIDVWAQYIDCPGEIYCRQAIESEASRLLSCEFYVHECSCGGKDCSSRCNYRLLAAGAFSLNIGQAQLAKDGTGVCGDSGGAVLLDEGRQLLMISDGMGVGAKAAGESSGAITLVSRLLEAGFAQDTAIDMVNAALSLRGNEESFVTLDLCVVDLYSGRADFIKSGSAASYIKRGGIVRTVKGNTLPVGMLYNADKEVISEQVAPGDMIILASDGLQEMDSRGDGQWLYRIIEQAVVNNPQNMAEYLLDKVIAVSNGRLKDDITVLVAMLGEAA
ncbi:MAG: stage II sporulation protein E [Bacillota bacterium]|nr:stage II sporulation protein E [Bacillota bacterium]